MTATNPYAAARREQKAAKISRLLRDAMADGILARLDLLPSDRNAAALTAARRLDAQGRREIERAAQVTSPSSDETWELAFQMLGRLLNGMFDQPADPLEDLGPKGPR